MTHEECPDAATLFDYSVGRLSDAESDALAAHLERCPICQAELETMHDADDTLVRRLREPLPEEPYVEESHCNVALARAKAVAGRSQTDASGPGDAPSSAAPGSLGEYRLLERLGQGGMGTVYRALHTKLDRVVALKILPKGRLEDRHAVARFEREMKAVGRLDHPNIVQAHDAREIDDMPVLIMQYVDGMDAAALVRRLGRLPAADACEIARQAALALQYAHENGLVHRDVKPSNLMLTRQGELKLLDLGLARFYREPRAEGEMTDTGQTMGTADYMAPEQVSSSREVDIRADVYSLGCTLYKLLSGRAPFSGPKYPGNFEKMTAHVEEPAPPIRERVPEVPEGLAALLDRTLAKAPDDRPATPAEVAELLEPFCERHDLDTLVQRAEERELASRPTAAQAQPADAVPCPAPSTKARLSVRMPVAIGLMAFSFVLGFALGFPLGIVIRIERDGKTTELTVPDGSRVEIGDEGRVDVKLPGPGEQAETPRVTAVAELAALRGWWEVVSVEKGEAADLFLEGPDSVARFDAGDVDRVLIRDDIHWYDLDQGAYYLMNYAVDPAPSPGTIDLLTPSTSNSPEETIARGVYALDGDTLRICVARYLPSLKAEQRAEGFRVEPRSGDVLFTLRRYEFTADEKALQEGAWRVVSAAVDGCELPAEELVAIASPYGGGLDEDRRGELSFMNYHFSTNAKFLAESLGGRGMGTSQLYGLCVLDPSQHPKAITLNCHTAYMGPAPEKTPRGIYELSGDRLRIAWREGGPRPKEFQSEPGSGVTLIELEREEAEAPAAKASDLQTLPQAKPKSESGTRPKGEAKASEPALDTLAAPPPRLPAIAPPVLSVEASAPGLVRRGEMAEFTFTVSNTGGPARNVEVAVSFDPPLVAQWASEGFRREDGHIRWTLDTLPTGATRTFVVKCEWTPEGDLACARVTVTAEGGAKASDEACLRIVADPEDAEGTGQALEAAAIQGKPAAAHPDHEAIQGVWQLAAATLQGEEMAEEPLGEVQIVFAQGRYRNLCPPVGGRLSSGSYVLDPTRDPKWIDFKWDERPGSVFGIYELDGDRLRVCYNAPGSPRPTGFVSEKRPPNDGLLVELRRVGNAEAALARFGVVPALPPTPTRGTATGDLEQIGLAMHTFHDACKHFPAAVLHQPLRDEPTAVGAGTPPAWQPYSWRVALLPFLGHDKLYEQYRFDEPWHSPANRKVLDQMPEVYRHPSAPPDSTNAAYFVLTGPGTIFDDERGSRFADIPDGTSSTILVVEAKRDIPWTKPEDIPFDPEKPLPKLGGFAPGGFHAVLADGLARFIPGSMDDDMLRAAIQKADGHEVIWPETPR
jgi:uncharacterized protein (TIGR03067 family)